MPLESVNLLDKKGNDEFVPTEQEVKLIHEKMKDPEFAKLMQEYMTSLSDPETRREEEEYLKQMEREAKEGGDYSFDFIFPKPGFVVELKQTFGYKKNVRVFVNVCESDRVEEFREETTGNRMGSNWHIPVAVSQERDEDHEGVKVSVYDAVFHPKTRQLADRSDRFLCFLVEIAVEHINAGYKKTFGFEFARQSSSLASIGTPQNQTVRKEKGKSAFPMSTEPVSHAPIRPQLTTNTPAASKPKSQAASSQPASAPTAPASALEAPKHELPKFTVLHEGSVDIQDAWQWKIVDKRVGVPLRLVVKIEFTGVSSAAHLDIEVAGPYVEIRKTDKCKYFGMIPLPFSVEETPASAKFDKSKQVLTLTLKVIPPERPADAVTADEMRAEQRKGQERDDVVTCEPAEVTPAAAPLQEVTEPTLSKEAPVVPSTVKHVDANDEISPISATPASAPVPIPSAPSAPKACEASHIAPDRASQLMAKLEEARKEREAAEQAEISAATGSASEAPLQEDAPEVIDLRKKQDEWMHSMKKEQEEKDRRRQEQEDEEQRKADEELRKQQRDARKKLDLEREVERQEAALQKKMNELPLKSRFIFSID
jgi:dynein assembly factor 2, axonemal